MLTGIICSTGEVAPDYKSYLLTRHWRQKRIALANNRKHKCQTCRKVFETDFEVHHKTYAHIGDERLRELMFLCHDCHVKLHQDNQRLANEIKHKSSRICPKCGNRLEQVKSILICPNCEYFESKDTPDKKRKRPASRGYRARKPLPKPTASLEKAKPTATFIGKHQEI